MEANTPAPSSNPSSTPQKRRGTLGKIGRAFGWTHEWMVHWRETLREADEDLKELNRINAELKSATNDHEPNDPQQEEREKENKGGADLVKLTNLAERLSAHFEEHQRNLREFSDTNGQPNPGREKYWNEGGGKQGYTSLRKDLHQCLNELAGQAYWNWQAKGDPKNIQKMFNDTKDLLEATIDPVTGSYKDNAALEHLKQELGTILETMRRARRGETQEKEKDYRDIPLSPDELTSFARRYHDSCESFDRLVNEKLITRDFWKNAELAHAVQHDKKPIAEKAEELLRSFRAAVRYSPPGAKKNTIRIAKDIESIPQKMQELIDAMSHQIHAFPREKPKGLTGKEIKNEGRWREMVTYPFRSLIYAALTATAVAGPPAGIAYGVGRLFDTSPPAPTPASSTPASPNTPTSSSPATPGIPSTSGTPDLQKQIEEWQKEQAERTD